MKLHTSTFLGRMGAQMSGEGSAVPRPYDKGWFLWVGPRKKSHLEKSRLMSPAGWSNAPADLLWEMIERLPFADYIRFGAVCVSWFRALSEKRRPPAPQVPLLLLPGERSGVRFFIQSENKEYHLDLPEMGLDHKCIGSSGGWLVSVDKFLEIHMFKPFSPSIHLRLPSIITLPDFEPFDLKEFHRFCITKVVVSSSTPIMVAGICTVSDQLLFAVAGDSSWRSVSIGYRNYPLHDIIFYRGHLYGMSCSGSAIVFDLSDVSNPKVTLIVRPPATYRLRRINDMRTFKYLVESPDGDLLQICRWKDRQVTKVRVFKMIHPDPDNWIELKSLGDFALFLGHNHSLALSTHDLPELRKNCIYFTDDRHSLFVWHAICNLGVYNMEDESFSPYSPSKFRLSRPPVWFDPTHLQQS